MRAFALTVMIMIPNFVCKPGAGASRVSRNAVNVVPCDCDHAAAGRAGAGLAPGAPGAGPRHPDARNQAGASPGHRAAEPARLLQRPRDPRLTSAQGRAEE